MSQDDTGPAHNANPDHTKQEDGQWKVVWEEFGCADETCSYKRWHEYVYQGFDSTVEEMHKDLLAEQREEPNRVRNVRMYASQVTWERVS